MSMDITSKIIDSNLRKRIQEIANVMDWKSKGIYLKDPITSYEKLKKRLLKEGDSELDLEIFLLKRYIGFVSRVLTISDAGLADLIPVETIMDLIISTISLMGLILKKGWIKDKGEELPFKDRFEFVPSETNLASENILKLMIGVLDV